MSYEFKKLSDVDVVSEPSEVANVLIEENGVIKKAPKTAVGGSGAGGTTILSYDYENITDANGNIVSVEQFMELFCNGRVLISKYGINGPDQADANLVTGYYFVETSGELSIYYANSDSISTIDLA